MKPKNILASLITILLFVFNSTAQNWSFLLLNDTTYFIADQDLSISDETKLHVNMSLVVDSNMVHSNGWKTYYMNKMPLKTNDSVSVNDTACISGMVLLQYENADNILGNSMKMKGDSCFLNFKNYNLLLLKSSTTSYTWSNSGNIQLDTVLVQNGQISNHYISAIDDKKVYKFSNNDEVILSKKYGIIGGKINGRSFEIAGREKTKEGSYLLNETGIFNFQIGDVFYYEGFEYSHGSQVGHSYKMNSEVIAKSVLGDSVEYTFRNVKESPNPFGIVVDIDSTREVYWNGKYKELNSVPSELEEVSYYTPGNNLGSSEGYHGEVGFNSTFSKPDVSIGRYHKAGFTTCKIYKDSLLFPTHRKPSLDDRGFFVRTYAKSLGIVVEKYHNEKSKVLKGYKRNGIKYGDFKLVNIEEVNGNGEIVVYPNPARNFIHLTNIPESGYSYQIFSINGSILKEGSVVVSSSINIENLSKGVFFLKVKKENEIVLNKKIMKL